MYVDVFAPAITISPAFQTIVRDPKPSSSTTELVSRVKVEPSLFDPEIIMDPVGASFTFSIIAVADVARLSVMPPPST